MLKTALGTILASIMTANRVQIVWQLIIGVILITLRILHKRWQEDDDKLTLWKLLCLIPPVIAGIHFLIYVRGYLPLLNDYKFIYIAAASSLFLLPFARREIGYKVTNILLGLASAACIIITLTFSTFHQYNFTNDSYSKSFHKMIVAMDRSYVLKEWKDVDFASLEEKYMPMVQEAEKEKSPAKFYDAVKAFGNELHDGHVGVEYRFDTDKYPLTDNTHEYGLSTVRVDDGQVIAVATSPEVNKLGIEDGTVITKWDNKPIDVAVKENVPDQGQAVERNDQFLSYMQVSRTGGETVDVSFLDKEGKEKTATLKDLGEEHTFEDAYHTLFRNMQIESEEDIERYLAENFSTKMLNDKVGYIKLNAMLMSLDSKEDTIGYLTGNHKWAREMFRKKLRDLKAQGMESLVIDMRANGGGLDEIGCALGDLLTTEHVYGQGIGYRKNGKYICTSPDHSIRGDGEFAYIKAVVLTNLRCVSAGDGTCLYLSKLPNVTLAGITDPNGSNQATGGSCVLSGGQVEIHYPIQLITNEDGEPNIDTKADRISRNPVEVRIPFDEEAAMKIFSEGEDYELDWAIDYLAGQQ